MLIFWPIMLFSNAQKILIMLQKCTYNSQYIAHYAQVELTTMLIKTPNRRHEETQLHYQSAAISILHVFRFKSGVINPLRVHNIIM